MKNKYQDAAFGPKYLVLGFKAASANEIQKRLKRAHKRALLRRINRRGHHAQNF